MTVLLAEMTRETIRRLAPRATAVLPTAAIEQHGAHLPIITDALLCETIARRAAERAATQAPVVVAPALVYGSSHHHRPFPGVLSLTSEHYMAAVVDLLEGLVLSGFKRLVVLNGHGGNTEALGVVALDLVNRLGHPVAVATAPYWEIARSALTAQGLIADGLIPGHAGRFETSLVLALRPDLVDREALAHAADMTGDKRGLYVGLSGAVVQVHGAWGSGPGYTDNPAAASAEAGEVMLSVIVERVAAFLAAFT